MTKDDIYKKAVVFFVEDENIIRESVDRILQYSFDHFHSFSDGKDVISAIENDIIPDIIVTDINMPHVNGIEMIKQIQKMDYLIPVIFVTGYSEREYINKAMGLNVKKFLLKPILNLKEIEQSIVEVLEACFAKNIMQKKISELRRWEYQLSQYVLFARTDKYGIITEVSEAFALLGGYSVDELIGKSYDVLGHHDRRHFSLLEILKKIKKNQSFEGEVKGKAKGGNYYWLHMNISAEYDEEGNIVGYFAIANDITAKKDFELHHVQQVEEAKLKSMSELIANITHQWRQPLSAITIQATNSLYQQEIGNLNQEGLTKSLNSINDYAQEMSSILDIFSGFIKSNKSLITIIIQERIKAAYQIVKLDMVNSNIRFIDKTQEKEEVNIELIEGELAQVLINIFKNAIEVLNDNYIEDKWIQIDLEVKDNHVVITIEDNGGGIDEKHIAHIFEAYFTTKHQSQGKGLGLHLSYKIVNEHLDGTLQVKNTQNGAKFIITLPL